MNRAEIEARCKDCRNMADACTCGCGLINLSPEEKEKIKTKNIGGSAMVDHIRNQDCCHHNIIILLKKQQNNQEELTRFFKGFAPPPSRCYYEREGHPFRLENNFLVPFKIQKL